MSNVKFGTSVFASTPSTFGVAALIRGANAVGADRVGDLGDLITCTPEALAGWRVAAVPGSAPGPSTSASQITCPAAWTSGISVNKFSAGRSALLDCVFLFRDLYLILLWDLYCVLFRNLDCIFLLDRYCVFFRDLDCVFLLDWYCVLFRDLFVVVFLGCVFLWNLNCVLFWDLNCVCFWYHSCFCF